ncbi:hypothetical protein Q3G72_022844 [Acer saccharum]|nr:hypothetical protein Q3G72_022844 [Acer saccharum]
MGDAQMPDVMMPRTARDFGNSAIINVINVETINAINAIKPFNDETVTAIEELKIVNQYQISSLPTKVGPENGEGKRSEAMSLRMMGIPL